MNGLPPVKTQYIPFAGGVDQVTPPIQVKPGVLSDSVNFDVGANGGYRRIDGYEKYDGSPSPLSYGFWGLAVAATAFLAPGRTLVGDVSGATGKVIATDNEGFVYLVRPTGTFQLGEGVSILGLPAGTVTGEAFQRNDRSDAFAAECMALAAAEYRQDIETVPGSGPIRGLCFYAGSLYAFRNNVGNTATGIYKATSTGWTEVTPSNEITFSAGAGTLAEGQTLTKGAVTAIIQRVVIESGTLAGSDAAGRLIISDPAGGSFTAGAATTAGGTLTLSGGHTAISLAPNGRFRFVLHNFGIEQRVYGCYGTGSAFEFDGTVLVPIQTGMATDTPAQIAVHKNHLFLSFDNSVQHSSIGNPYQWQPITGAAEINMGELVTNFLSQPSDATSGGAMAISTRNSMWVLYGSSSADWNLVALQRDVGAFAHTMQAIAATTYFLDDRGVASLVGVKEFGNFASATISAKVRPWLMDRKTSVIDSCVVKEKNQLRFFFAGGTGMHVTFLGANPVGLMPVQYAHNITIALSTELADGLDATFYGDDSGNVYLADVGPSFAGETITAFFKLHFDHCQSPRIDKRFRKVTFEVKGTGYSDFQTGYELGYGDGDIPMDAIATIDSRFTGPRWDDPANYWDAGVWDGRVLLPVEVSLSGTAENISLVVFQTSSRYDSLNFQGAIIQYTPRRLKR